MGSVMDNSFIGNGVVSDGYYTSDPNTSVKFPKPKLYTTLADFIGYGSVRADRACPGGL